MTEPLATPDDLADIWRPLTAAEEARAIELISKASARLRQKCPFDIDERAALFGTDPANPLALDPQVVADVVAGIVKRVMVNPDGILSGSETRGPFSRSQVFASRTSDSGDSGSSLRVTEADIDQLRPSRTALTAATIRLRPDIPLAQGGVVCDWWPV